MVLIALVLALMFEDYILIFSLGKAGIAIIKFYIQIPELGIRDSI